VLPRLETDLLRLLWSAARRTLAGFRLEVRPQSAICVVVAAQGYPGPYRSADPIDIPAALPEGVVVLHAGTSRNAGGGLVTAGGRVLGVTAVADTLREAADRCYAVCGQIRCPSKYYRSDIGARQLRRL
jgi:phosphoribosylamine---glycine ligase